MPKPMLRPFQKQSNATLSTSKNQLVDKNRSSISKIKLDRLLRKPRSESYMTAVSKLDAGGHVHNQQAVNEIIDSIRNEFPDLEINSIMLGIVSKCYLGRPYEVHTLDISGQIIEHYKAGYTLPSGLEKARGIAIRGNYEFIEVYVDSCRAISSNGTVSVINDEK